MSNKRNRRRQQGKKYARQRKLRGAVVRASRREIFFDKFPGRAR